MDKIQALQNIRKVLDELNSLSQDHKVKYNGVEAVEEAYEIIHAAVENDMKDFHLGDYLMDQIKSGDLICYNYLREIDGFELKLSIQPTKKESGETEK